VTLGLFRLPMHPPEQPRAETPRAGAVSRRAQVAQAQPLGVPPLVASKPGRHRARSFEPRHLEAASA
jgi:hypothetical protein